MLNSQHMVKDIGFAAVKLDNIPKYGPEFVCLLLNGTEEMKDRVDHEGRLQINPALFHTSMSCHRPSPG